MAAAKDSTAVVKRACLMAGIVDAGAPADLLLRFLGYHHYTDDMQRKRDRGSYSYFWGLGALLSSCKAWARHGDGAWVLLRDMFEAAVPSPLRLSFAAQRHTTLYCLHHKDPAYADTHSVDWDGETALDGVVAHIAEGPAEGPAPGPHAARPTSARVAFFLDAERFMLCTR